MFKFEQTYHRHNQEPIAQNNALYFEQSVFSNFALLERATYLQNNSDNYERPINVIHAVNNRFCRRRRARETRKRVLQRMRTFGSGGPVGGTRFNSRKKKLRGFPFAETGDDCQFCDAAIFK